MGEAGESASVRPALSGSVREPLRGARRVGDVDPGTPVELTIGRLRRRAPSEAAALEQVEAQARLAGSSSADLAGMVAVEAYPGGHHSNSTGTGRRR